jgi:antitoxin MazE
MNVTQTIQKWGNSTAIRLPKKVIDAAKLHVNQSVDITVTNGTVILKPSKNVTVDTLLAGVTPPMVGGELDWQQDVGNEINA